MKHPVEYLHILMVHEVKIIIHESLDVSRQAFSPNGFHI